MPVTVSPPDLKKIMVGGGVSGQLENPSGYATGHNTCDCVYDTSNRLADDAGR